MEFVAQSSPTIGCEWELELLTAGNLDLADGILALLRDFDGEPNVKAEFVQSCVELTSGPATTVADLTSELRGLLARVIRACDTHDMRLAGSGTHPFSRKHALLTPSARYLALSRERGSPVPQPATFATHVHVACRSGDAAIRAMRRLTPCLPGLLALGSNSPFCSGFDTGFHCYRQRVLTSNPTYGPPPYFEDWHDFDGSLDVAFETGSIRTFKDLHWDIRPHPDFGTLEIRVLDSQIDVERIAEISALIRFLVVMACESDSPPLFPRLPPWFEKENYFRAARDGLDAELIASMGGEIVPVRALLHRWIDGLWHVAKDCGDSACLERLESNIDRSNGAIRQRREQRQGRSLIDVTAYLVEELKRSARPDDPAAVPAQDRGSAVG